MKVTIIHPDLGIGGAERLVVDAAHAFRSKGHEVRIVTNQFSKSHCFSDLQDFFNDITVVVPWLPRSFFGRFYAFCAYTRILFAALYICFFQRDTDVIFCDQISAPLFVFRCLLSAKLLFYCHYPDQLLTRRDSLPKKCYRFFLDHLECFTTGMADVIFVNSRFTESVFRRQFPSLIDMPVNILYPSFNIKIPAADGGDSGDGIDSRFKCVFLSINRFEVKKNIELAIRAFAMFRDRVTAETFSECGLVIAGGYDPLNDENIAYYKHLQSVVDELDFNESVIFLRSPSDDRKSLLLNRCRLVVYTPENEHFGIVPLEAMYMNRAVLATSSGGPLETVLDGETGFLRKSDPAEFAEVMQYVYEHTDEVRKMGTRGHARVVERFSFQQFSNQLNSFL